MQMTGRPGGCRYGIQPGLAVVRPMTVPAKASTVVSMISFLRSTMPHFRRDRRGQTQHPFRHGHPPYRGYWRLCINPPAPASPQARDGRGVRENEALPPAGCRISNRSAAKSALHGDAHVETAAYAPFAVLLGVFQDRPISPVDPSARCCRGHGKDLIPCSITVDERRGIRPWDGGSYITLICQRWPARCPCRPACAQ